MAARMPRYPTNYTDMASKFMRSSASDNGNLPGQQTDGRGPAVTFFPSPMTAFRNRGDCIQFVNTGR